MYMYIVASSCSYVVTASKYYPPLGQHIGINEAETVYTIITNVYIS